MIKRITSLIITFALLLTFVSTPASAAVDTRIKLLIDLGVVDEASKSLVIIKKYSRSDFAKALAMMDGSGTGFFDVTKVDATDIDKDKNYQSIIEVVRMGYMTVEEGKFRPNDSITKLEAAKAAIRALGYEKLVIEDGGTDFNYLTWATKLGVFNKVIITDDNSLSYDEAVQIIYNIMETPHYSGLSYANRYTRCFFDNWNLTEYNGRVLANSNLGLEVEAAPDGYVNIDGKIIKTDIQFDDIYVGCEVTYYTTDEGADERIVSFIEYSRTKAIEVKPDDIGLISRESTTFKITLNNNKKIKLSQNAYMLVNGETVSPTINLLNAFESGKATFIDSNGDGVYDVVNMALLEQGIVEGVSPNDNRIVVRVGSSMHVVNLDDVDTVKIYRGRKIGKIDDIKIGMVAGIGVDRFTVTSSGVTFNYSNPNFINIYVSERVESGYVESIDTDKNVHIDGINFPVGKGYIDLVTAGFMTDIKPGTDILIYLDSFGKIVYWEKDPSSSDYKYGYVIKAANDNSPFVNNLMMNIMGSDGEIKIFSTQGQKFILDGKVTNVSKTGVVYMVGTSEVDFSKRQLVRYRSKGDILREIDTKVIRAGYEDEKISLNVDLPFDFYSEDQSHTKIRYKRIGKRFIVPDNCIVFIDEDYNRTDVDDRNFSVQGASAVETTGSYAIEGFDATDTRELPVMVLYKNYGVTPGTDEVRQSLAPEAGGCYVVEKISNCIQDEEEGWFFTMYGPLGKVKYFVPKDINSVYTYRSVADWKERIDIYRVDINNLENTIKKGDLIRFKLDASNTRITYIEKLFDLESNKETLVKAPETGGSKYGFARVERAGDKTVVYNYNDIGDSTEYVFNFANGYGQIPVYNVSRGTAEMRNMKDLPSNVMGDDAKVFLRYYDDTVIMDHIVYLFE